MPRAVVTYKTKDELMALPANELNDYIYWLRQKASSLGTLPRKEVEKKIAIAEKLRRRFSSHESN